METLEQMQRSTIKGLQGLIRLNLDSAEGYEKAAEQIDSPVLSSAFHEISAERRAYAEELRAYVVISDSDPASDGTAKGSIHRMWMSVRKALSQDGDHAVLEEVVRGESAIADKYKEVILDTKANPVSDALHRQLRAIVERRDSMERLAEAYDEVA